MVSGNELTLSDNAAIETILTQIPLFCVGLVAFAVFTFLIIVRRITWLVAFLYLSSLFAFGAAIFDLSQTLRNDSNSEKSHEDLHAGLINTREVALSLSFGFRFAFFWSFIAEKPRGEPPPVSFTPGQPKPKDATHCASWARWGYLGVLLKWILLALVLGVPVLQIVWRIAARRMGTVYMIDFTFEIIASGLFILKIFLNVSLSLRRPRYKILLYYLVPLTALLCNLGLAVGALIFFPFSETTLGRFLQSVVLYLLIVYVLVMTFWHERRGMTNHSTHRMLERGSSSFLIGSAEQEDSHTKTAPQVDVSTTVERPSPRGTSLFVLLTTPVSQNNGQGTPNSRQLRKPSSFLTIPQLSPSGSSTMSTNLRPSPRLGMATMTSQSGSRKEQAADTSVATEASARLKAGISGLSDSSYYFDQGSASPRRSRFSEIRMDSPVYGLNGTMREIPTSHDRKLRRISSLPSVVPASEHDKRASLDQLLQQQAELDKSIAALKLLSPRNSLETQKATTPPSPSRPDISRKTTESTVSQAESSYSSKSELSLRDFPQPPGDDASPTPSAPSFAFARRHQRRRSDSFPLGIPSTTLSELLTPTRISNAQQQSYGRLGSHGTQYDVTSFIGDLSTPRFRGSTAVASSVISYEESEGSPRIVTADFAQPTRSILLESHHSSPLRSITYRSSSQSLRPLLLPSLGGTATPWYPSPLSRGSMPTSEQSVSKTARITISKPRPLILQSEHRNDISDTSLEFERPRTPPRIE